MKFTYEWARHLALPILVLALAALIFWLPIISPEVFITAEKKGDFISPDNGEFMIIYRHSVNKGEIMEYYSADYDTKTINLQSCKFQSYGAGMPDQFPDGVTVTYEDDFIVLDFPQNPQSGIFILPGREADHKLVYNKNGEEKIYYLADIFPYRQIKIEIKRPSVFAYIINQLGG